MPTTDRTASHAWGRRTLVAWVAAQYRVFVSAADATSVTLTFANQTQRADCTYRKSTGDLIAFSAAGTEGIHQSAGEATFVSRR